MTNYQAMHEFNLSMNLRNIPLNGLKTFEAVGRHLHMNKAAEELGVTQSAVSHQVKKLEAYLNVQLIYRDGKSTRLTALGRQLLEDIQTGFSKLQQATLNLDPTILDGKIRLGCTSALCSNWLLTVFEQFFYQHPNISFELSHLTANSEIVLDDIDVAICYGKTDHQQYSKKLIDINLFPIASKELFGSSNLQNKLDDLLDYPLLLDDEKNWESFLVQHGLSSERIQNSHSIRFFDSSHAIEGARNGLGIALADSLEVAHDIKNGRLIKLTDFKLITDKSYFLVSNQHNNNRVSLFIEWLLKQFEK